MKHYLLLFLTVIVLFSCSDDDDENYHFEYVPVVSAEVPEEFVQGETHLIKVTAELPSSCYSLYHYDYIYDDTARLIYPIAIVNDDDACTLAVSEVTFTIPVEALQEEPYIFKFWQGEDDQGEDQYLIIEVPVI